MGFPFHARRNGPRFHVSDAGFAYTERTPVRTGRRNPGGLIALVVLLGLLLIVIALLA